MLKEGERVYTLLRHVASTGMSRIIDAFVVRDGKVVSLQSVLTEAQKRRIPFRQHPTKDGYKVHGVGMDAGHHLVYTISNSLFNDGYKLEQEWL